MVKMFLESQLMRLWQGNDRMWIEKILTENDLGLNSSHQAGIHIPKSQMSALPKLPKSEKNPRYSLNLTDLEGNSWPVSLIYYNNKFHGGTRNEVRLTGTIHCFRHHNCQLNDTIRLNFSTPGQVMIQFLHKAGFKEESAVEKDIHQNVEEENTESAGEQGWTTHRIRRKR